MKGHSVLHVVKDTVHNIDYALDCIHDASTDSKSVATLYAFAGCDYLPGTFGLSHDTFLKAYIGRTSDIGKFNFNTSPELYETVMCLAYLYKEGKKVSITAGEKGAFMNSLLLRVRNGDLSRTDMMKQGKELFVSEYAVGSPRWKVDVRNFISDCASSVC